MTPEQWEELASRMIRIETRLCQLMAHGGLDPYENHTRKQKETKHVPHQI